MRFCSRGARFFCKQYCTSLLPGSWRGFLLKQACQAVSGREAKKTELQLLVDHWPLFYRGCLGCVGVLKDWLIRTVSAALRKGDAKLTLELVPDDK